LTCLTMSWESPFTRSCWTPSNKVVFNPKSRASYSAMLLVALKSRCTMYLIWSPCGGEEYYPRVGPLLTRGAVEEKSLVGSNEDWSFGLWLTVIWAP
jgi:hypothetical protein